jgi:hypothetical protein
VCTMSATCTNFHVNDVYKRPTEWTGELRHDRLKWMTNDRHLVPITHSKHETDGSDGSSVAKPSVRENAQSIKRHSKCDGTPNSTSPEPEVKVVQKYTLFAQNFDNIVWVFNSRTIVTKATGSELLQREREKANEIDRKADEMRCSLERSRKNHHQLIALNHSHSCSSPSDLSV